MIKFCWHKWGRWSKGIESYGGSIHQVCECEKCGAIKRRLAIFIGRAKIGAGVIEAALKETRK